jgi:hypothetical protein
MRGARRKWLIVGLTIAVLAVTAATTAAPFAQADVSISSGQTAIQRFSARVQRLTQASSYQVSKCSTGGSGVTCQVRWAYKAKDTYYDSNTDTWRTRRRVVLACSLKALAYPANGALKVKSATPVRCKSFD